MRLIDGSYVYASLGDGEDAESRIKQLRRGDIIPSTQDGLHTVWVPQSAVVWFEEHKLPTLESGKRTEQRIAHRADNPARSPTRRPDRRVLHLAEQSSPRVTSAARAFPLGGPSTSRYLLGHNPASTLEDYVPPIAPSPAKDSRMTRRSSAERTSERCSRPGPAVHLPGVRPAGPADEPPTGRASRGVDLLTPNRAGDPPLANWQVHFELECHESRLSSGDTAHYPCRLTAWHPRRHGSECRKPRRWGLLAGLFSGTHQ